MYEQPKETDRFLEAAEFLPREMRYAAVLLQKEKRDCCEEFRLRVGRAPSIVLNGEESPLPGRDGQKVYQSDLATVLELATAASAHTALERVRHGFLTVKGGHRIGLCGTAVVREGEVSNLKDLSSVCIRIAREMPGVASEIVEKVSDGRHFLSTLILSPPGVGKTTLLRDLIRILSGGDAESPVSPFRVGLADERGEVAAMYGGQPQMNIGKQTDVMDGCPKAQGLSMLLRGMNPDILAADEITAAEDVEALSEAANCGVALLVTAHGSDLNDLKGRPLYRKLMEQDIFSRVVLIERTGEGRSYRVYRREEFG